MQIFSPWNFQQTFFFNSACIFHAPLALRMYESVARANFITRDSALITIEMLNNHSIGKFISKTNIKNNQWLTLLSSLSSSSSNHTTERRERTGCVAVLHGRMRLSIDERVTVAYNTSLPALVHIEGPSRILPHMLTVNHCRHLS